VEVVDREPGSTTIGVSITYQNQFVERWGRP
jgi:hypothetical protein